MYNNSRLDLKIDLSGLKLLIDDAVIFTINSGWRSPLYKKIKIPTFRGKDKKISLTFHHLSQLMLRLETLQSQS